VAELAQKYRLGDENGKLPASLRSFRFIWPMVWPFLRKYSGLIPDLKVPWFMILLTGLSSPKI
jgi:hypothetical protein